MNKYLKKIKKNKKYVLSKKDIIFIEALKSDGIEISKKYNDKVDDDYRYHADVKNTDKTKCIPYIQMFQDRNNFLNNLSILDLLFMEGPNSINFLK